VIELVLFTFTVYNVVVYPAPCFFLFVPVVVLLYVLDKAVDNILLPGVCYCSNYPTV